MQHCSRVAAAAAGIAGMDEGIIGEEIVDVENVEEVGYGETGFLDGSSSTQESKNSVGLVAESKISMD